MALRQDIDRMLSAFGLSHDDVNRTQLGDTQNGGHHAEPDQEPKRELLDSDEAQRREPPMSLVRSKERHEPSGRRLHAVDAVPLVRLAHGPEGDVDPLPSPAPAPSRMNPSSAHPWPRTPAGRHRDS